MWTTLESVYIYNLKHIRHAATEVSNQIVWLGDHTLLRSDRSMNTDLVEYIKQVAKPNRLFVLYINHTNGKDKLKPLIHMLLEHINDLCVVLATKPDQYSKPYTGIPKLLGLIDPGWLMIGNSAGRIGLNCARDHSDRDRAFASNLGITFKTTDALLEKPLKQDWYWRDRLRISEREEYYTVMKKLADSKNSQIQIDSRTVLVIFGPPASGKSSYATSLNCPNVYDCNNITKPVDLLTAASDPRLPAVFVVDSKKNIHAVLEQLCKSEHDIILINWSVNERLCYLLSHAQICSGQRSGPRFGQIQQFFSTPCQISDNVRGKIRIIKQYLDIDIDNPYLWFHYSDLY